MKKNYLIEYEVRCTKNLIIKEGTMRVKNKESSIQAQVNFETWLKKKYTNFGSLVVHKCTEDKIGDIFKGFGDIFGNSSKNPFGF